MTRHGGRRPPPIDDRDLAAEVLYLHSLWRRGPSAPAPVPVPVPAAAPNQFPSGRRRPRNRKRRRSGRGGGDSDDAGPDSPRAPFPPPSPDASASASAEESTPPPPAPAAVPVPASAVTNQSHSGRRRPRRRKRRRSGRENADSEDAGGDSPHAPSPPASPNAPSSPWPQAYTWPDGPTSSKPPPPPPSPGSLAHREALRAAADFFTSHGSDGEEEEDDEEVSESEGDEEEAAEFFTGMFERDAALRRHYERGWEEGQFACMACAGRRKARRGRARRFRGCVGLVQHARAATRFGRPAAHRALATVICRVLGWDIDRLPSIVIDPRGTLSQALAARVQSDAQKAKETVETEIEGSNHDVDKVANELVTSKESAGMNDVEENGSLNSEGNSKSNVRSHETIQEEDAIKTGMEEPLSIDGEKVATELDGDKESSEKEGAVKTGMEEPLSIDGEKVATGLDGDKESFQKDNASKDNSLIQGNNGVVHEQGIAIESTEKENTEDTCSKYKCENEKNCTKASVQEEVNATVSEPEHAKTADGIGDTTVTRLGNTPAEENVDENKEHANSIVKFYEELEGEDLFTS